MFRRSSQFFDENWRASSFKWFFACDRCFSCKASSRANLVTQIIDNEACACFWSLHCIVHFRTIERVDLRSFTIRLSRRLIAEIFVFYLRRCLFRELWSRVVTWSRALSLFWPCSNQWAFTLCVRLARNSTSCRYLFLRKRRCF